MLGLAIQFVIKLLKHRNDVAHIAITCSPTVTVLVSEYIIVGAWVKINLPNSVDPPPSLRSLLTAYESNLAETTDHIVCTAEPNNILCGLSVDSLVN